MLHLCDLCFPEYFSFRKYWHSSFFLFAKTRLVWFGFVSFYGTSNIVGCQIHFIDIVFNWNHSEMRLLNLRINFYLLWTFCPHLGSFFVLFLLSLRFAQISPLAFFRWFTATSNRNNESCNRIPSNYCLP